MNRFFQYGMISRFPMVSTMRCGVFSVLGSMGILPVYGRTWTNDQGVQIEGELVRVLEKEIVLKLSNGRKAVVPQSVLSSDDASYVREWEQAHPLGAEQEDEGGVSAEKTDFSEPKEWPSRVQLPSVFLSKTIQESPSFSVYESDHFHIESSAILHKEEKEFLVSAFESAWHVLSALPVDFSITRPAAGLLIIQVFFDEEEYVKAGGKRDFRVSMTPTRLLVHLKRTRKGNPLRLKDVKPMETFTQWLSQFSGDIYWFNAGVSSYLKDIPVNKNSCDFSDWKKVAASIPGSIRKRRLSLPPLQSLMTCRGDLSGEKNRRTKTRMRYGAFIAAVYFLRMDGEGNAERMAKYMKALQMGEDNPLHLLLNKRSWDELERDIAGAWKKRGVSLRFEKAEAGK